MRLNRKCYLVRVAGILTKMLSELFQKLSWRENIHYMLFRMLLVTSGEVQILATYTHSFRHFPVLVPCLLIENIFIHHIRKGIIISNRKYMHFDDERKAFTIFGGIQSGSEHVLLENY